MQIKTILIFVGVSAGVLMGMTVLLWNYSNVEELSVEGIAGEMRHVKGEGEIIVTEWSDFQCPACAGVQRELSELLERYKGQVKLVYRHLPLTSIHPHAVEAAVMAEAAGEQGKFWEMHDLLYVNQREWEGMVEVTSKFGEYAIELGLDMEKLASDLEREELEQRVLLDGREAVGYKIQGTPTFFVDGEKVTFSGLEAKIQSKLSE